ncbi:transporter [Bradyrhizobium sp. WSM3983]|uniref:SphA family protein n=1 Tax=Bradyrhizobium sp. WSM3983 TaxID=1038867 RepID=UPI0012EB67A6|nr:transporter [Bradyrhizobium sp. WSM3983]
MTSAKLITVASLLIASSVAAQAFEVGSSGWTQKPGITLGGGSAGLPDPGIYQFDQFLSYSAHRVGPSAPMVGGTPLQIRSANEGVGLLFVPGWEFLGFKYDAVFVQPFVSTSVGPPFSSQNVGVFNSYVVPIELSRSLGDSGFKIKTGLGIYFPDGDSFGPAGLSGAAYPWWTFQPEFIVSYLKDGWNLTANIFDELHTRNSVTQYQSGDVLHAEFTVAKTIDKWTVGGVGYYAGQVTSDKSSAFYNNVINTRSYDIWGVGARVGYDFGPVALNVWCLKEVSTHVVGATPALGSAPNGTTVFASLSYRLWSFDKPDTPKVPLIRK